MELRSGGVLELRGGGIKEWRSASSTDALAWVGRSFGVEELKSLGVQR
jgi:hypothetical protein